SRERRHLPGRQPATLRWSFPKSGRARPQRRHRQGEKRRDRPPHRTPRSARRAKPAGGARGPGSSSARRLWLLVWAIGEAAVRSGALPLELALASLLRRRPAHGLDRAPQRHRALGARLRRERPGGGARGRLRVSRGSARLERRVEVRGPVQVRRRRDDEEHTSELQWRENLVCRLLLGKKICML